MSASMLQSVLRTPTSVSVSASKHLAGPSRRSLPRNRPRPVPRNQARLGPICRIHGYSTSAPASSPSSSSTPTFTSTSTSNAPIQRPHPHQHPAFEQLASALSSTQPCFGARGDEVELLTSPEGFYKRLIEMVKRAKRRVIISSLYIGTEESELVEVIRKVLASNPQLRVTFILDYHRATRLSSPTASGSTSSLPPSTAHLLLPLVESFPDRCEVWLFRSPKLRGLMEKIVPARYDEGWGTWHGKWYGVDDEVLISGANLAQSYFTNRQDRYIHFRQHPSLLSYLSSLTRLFTQYSYLLHHAPPAHISPYYTVPLPNPSNDPATPSEKSTAQSGSRAYLIWPSASIHPRKFHTHALATLTAFQNSWKASNPGRSRRVDVDTWFWPVVQAGVLGVKEEERALGQVWKAVKDSYEGDTEGGRVSVDLTSGYFGLYQTYKKAVIDSPASVNVIAASPKANGFYGSKGFSRLIPEGYTLLESRFHREAVRRGRAWDEEKGTGVRLKEWEKQGWTYHSKGLWLTPASSSSASSSEKDAQAQAQAHALIPAGAHPPASAQPSKPFLTFIGSSNLSTRSLTLDTELSMVMMTSSPSLRKALGAEVKALDKHAVDVGEETWKSEERRVSLLARVLVALGVEGML
ncbi:CDP-diacylglycerol-glycerol-3-phosphate 3-phosphatidyltransferase [Kwoniella heveanensis CBS 569]|nr:CDP-diacylglycerol-glycerol-3-phosphate 3-phosphatidyltransferase [Kwoniella heveanensis CBS 569]